MHDPFDLNRFVVAQERVWPAVRDELASGRKRTHWMWFVFPQHVALGRSATARDRHVATRAEEPEGHTSGVDGSGADGERPTS